MTQWKLLETVKTVGYIICCGVQEKITLRIDHSDTEVLSYWWCTYKRILHKNAVHHFGQRKLCILKQQFVLSKIILCKKLQVLTNFDTH